MKTRYATKSGKGSRQNGRRVRPPAARKDEEERRGIKGEALEISEEKFRRLFEAAQDGILLLDAGTGVINEANPFIEQLLGYSRVELIGKKIWEVGPFKDVTASQAAFLELQKKKYILYEDLPLETKDGSRREVEFVSNVYRVGGQKVIQCNIRDITERKQAEAIHRESEERFRSLFENMLNGFAYCEMIFDEGGDPQDFIYLEVNRAFETLTGLTKVAGKKVSEVIPGIRQSDPELFEIYGRVARTGKAEVFESYVEALKMWFSISVYSPQKEYFVAVFDVITERKQAEEALLASEARYRHTLDAMLEGCQIIGFDWRYLYLNDVADRHNRRPKEELLGKKYMEMWPGIESTEVFTALRRCMEERSPQSMENRFTFPDGGKGWFELRIYPVPEGIVILSIDITERKRAEEEIAALAKFPSENPYPILRLDEHGVILYANQASQGLLAEWGRKDGEEAPKAWQEIASEVLASRATRMVETSSNGRVFSFFVVPIMEANYVNLYGRDITERKLVEEALGESETNFRTLAENAGEGILIAGEGGVHLFANRACAEITGYSVDELLHLNARELAHPDEAPKIMERLQKRLGGENIPNRYETAIASKKGLKVPVEISSNKTIWRSQPADLVFIQDITSRKLAEVELQRTLEELKRSNADLEQFAYVASHDLQEPLRMVSSYMQLLERRYKGKLDKDADEFIDYAVDGAGRMQRLINDLLAYSRLGTRGQPFAPTSSERVLGQTLENLQLAIQESKAEVTHDPLPEVLADETQLAQLFQNLLGNAIKFHGRKKPHVHISVEGNSREWIFSVRDNGIGIDPQYADRIFIIFQRLHGRSQYAGTGIGLAMCKKIVQRHGGRIWVESQPGKGATFFFTLPKTEVNDHDGKN
jgi:PAS domain S-box-containing protein